MKEGEETLNVEQANGYVKPAVTKDSELLAKQKKQLNELANVQVTYELPEGEKVLNGNTVKKWLNLDEDGNYSLDQDKMIRNWRRNSIRWEKKDHFIRLQDWM